MLLALKTEEEPRRQEMKWPLEGGKGKGLDFFLEPLKEMQFFSTDTLKPSETHFELLTSMTIK